MRLTRLVRDVRRALPETRVLVVDDGSGPAYEGVLAAARAAGAVVTGYPVNAGKGEALRTGLARVIRLWPGADVVCADADGQHTPADIAAVARRVHETGRMTLGVRAFTGSVPLRSQLGNSVTALLFRGATGWRLRDTQTGLRGYPADELEWLLEVPGDRYEYELSTLLRSHELGMAVEEIEIATVYEPGNASSHFRPLRDSARIYAPLLRFTGASLASFVIDWIGVVVLHLLTGSLLTSVVGARLISGAANFFMNRRVFRAAPGTVGRTAVRYVALALALVAASYLALASRSIRRRPLRITSGAARPASRPRLHETRFVGGDHELGAIPCVQAGQQRGDVAAAGGSSDAELGLDLRIGQSSGDEHEHVPLARSQPPQCRGRADRARPSTRSTRSTRNTCGARAPCGQRRHHLGTEQRLSRMDGAHGIDDRLRTGVLEKEARGPCPQRPQHIVLNLEHGQDEYARARERRVGADAAGGLDAGEPGHLNVHDDDVGAQPGGQRHGLRPVGRPTDDMEIGLGVHERGERGAQKRLILGDEHSDGTWRRLSHFGGRLGTRANRRSGRLFIHGDSPRPHTPGSANSTPRWRRQPPLPGGPQSLRPDPTAPRPAA